MVVDHGRQQNTKKILKKDPRLVPRARPKFVCPRDHVLNTQITPKVVVKVFRDSDYANNALNF